MAPRSSATGGPFWAATLITLGWGALAFGAEYAWAYAPLLVLCTAVGTLGLLVATGAHRHRALRIALAGLCLVGLVQVLPLVPADAADAAGRAADFQRLYREVTLQPEAGDGAGGSGRRSISIAPGRTLVGLAFLAALALMFLGTVAALSALGTTGAVRIVVSLGVLVALVGIVQSAVRSEAVYGFWYPPKTGPFAPFRNENHFAGWMVMAMSVAMGWFAGGVARGLRGVKAGWRNRVLRFSSPKASETVLTGFAVAVMALSMVVTLSRGGLVGLVTAMLIASWWVVRRQSSGARRFAAAGYLMIALVAAASWGDVERTLSQFEGSTDTVGGRLAVWQDAWRIVQDYPLTGTGLNTFGIAMLHYQSGARNEVFIEAHNDYLQLAAEGGLMLGLPILMILALFVREVWRRFEERVDDTRTYWLRAGAVTGLISIAVHEVYDFTLQMPGAAALFVVLAALAVHQPYDRRRRHT